MRCDGPSTQANNTANSTPSNFNLDKPIIKLNSLGNTIASIVDSLPKPSAALNKIINDFQEIGAFVDFTKRYQDLIKESEKEIEVLKEKEKKLKRDTLLLAFETMEIVLKEVFKRIPYNTKESVILGVIVSQLSFYNFLARELSQKPVSPPVD